MDILLDSNNTNNILLIGFMGCGKSTVGRILAKELDTIFLDTDILIESCESKSISKIFNEEGEEYFRSLEARVAKWILKSARDAIISTGGGFLNCGIDLKKLGTIFYLNLDFDKINDRINGIELEKRPLFKNIEQAKELFYKRSEEYTKNAHFIIDAAREPKDISKNIIKILHYKIEA